MVGASFLTYVIVAQHCRCARCGLSGIVLRLISLYFSFLVTLTAIYHSKIWHELLTTKLPRKFSLGVRNSFPSGDCVSPDPSEIRGHHTQTMRRGWGGSHMPSVNDILASFATNGPLLPRLILAGALASPIVAISLQRDTVDIGGNQGILSVGELPADIAAEDLNWVPLRRYTAAEGGLPAPDEFPNEVHFKCVLLSA